MGGDFVESRLARAVDVAERNALLVRAYQDLARQRRCIVFCVNVAHAQDVAAQDLVGPMGMATVGLPVEFFVSAPSGYKATPDDLRALIRAAIQEVAQEGRAVIVAHAASMALSGVDGVLRVLVTASAKARAQRIAADQALTASAAAAAIAASDRERSDYLLRFYKIKEELPTHYDLVINTDRLTAGQVTDIIAAAAQSGT